jgi:hypothetical protein
MSGTELEPPKDEGTEKPTRAFTHVAAFLAGIAVVLLFFIFWGIPGGFESYVHRDDVLWQERNNPTTSTTVPEPLGDGLRAAIQAELDEAVAALRAWDEIAQASWDDLSPDTQAAYMSTGAWWGPITTHLSNFIEFVSYWPNVFHGAVYGEYESGAEAGWETHTLRNTADIERRQLELIELVSALQREVDLVSLSLIQATRYVDYNATEADRALLRAWEHTQSAVAERLRDVLGTYGIALSSWYREKG